MKTIDKIMFAAALMLSLMPAALAQTDESAVYRQNYERLIARVGASGVGVETLIDRWEDACPADAYMLEARFNYWLAKSRGTTVVRKDASKYLGNKPVLSLPDSTGKPVNYFEEPVFVDSLFAKASTIADRLVAEHPSELMYRFDKVTSLLAYEKESPDMAYAELMKMIDIQASGKMGWTLEGKEVGDDTFVEVIQEYCVAFFKIASPNSYEAFNALSQRMNKLYPKKAVFLDNMGSYQLVVAKNNRKALKYYKKALKMDPEDSTAKQNITLIERIQAQARR